MSDNATTTTIAQGVKFVAAVRAAFPEYNWIKDKDDWLLWTHPKSAQRLEFAFDPRMQNSPLYRVRVGNVYSWHSTLIEALEAAQSRVEKGK